MAVAEARAVWQRTANRCFVQEDAKRAPKLACCQSSSAPKQVDAGPAATADGQDHLPLGFMPLNRNPSASNLSPDSRWWLQMQPNYGYQKGFTFEQINALEKDDGTAKAGVVKATSRISEAHKRKGYVTDLDRNNNYYFAEENHGGARKKVSEVETVGGKNMQELIELEGSMDSWETMAMDPTECPDNKKPREMCFDSEYSFLGSEKSEPWWWMADKDELVSLVARKSLDHVENCDLPPPQKMCHGRPLYSRVGHFDNKEISTSLDRKTQTTTLSSIMTVRSQGFGNTGKSQEKRGSDETSSYGTTQKFMPEIQPDSEGELSKAQLIEALCHSQTRAREAEKAAKKACAEKEHIVTLFFRQASLLFAYKQWFQLLQLESLCLQFKKNDKQVSTLFPLSLPWLSSSKDRKPRASLHKGVKINPGEKRGRPSIDMTKYAVAFALGLSLVGAGLLLGWTVGWMLPRF